MADFDPKSKKFKAKKEVKERLFNPMCYHLSRSELSTIEANILTERKENNLPECELKLLLFLGIHTFCPSHVSPLLNLEEHFAPKMCIKKAALINCNKLGAKTCEDEMCEINRGEMCEGQNVPLDLRGAKRGTVLFL